MQVAKKAGVKTNKIKNIIAWGNHNSTVFPDVFFGTINKKSIT